MDSTSVNASLGADINRSDPTLGEDLLSKTEALRTNKKTISQQEQE
jgi:hypothetical protein